MCASRIVGRTVGEIGRGQIIGGHFGHSLDFRIFPSCGKKQLEGPKDSVVCSMANTLRRTRVKVGKWLEVTIGGE